MVQKSEHNSVIGVWPHPARSPPQVEMEYSASEVAGEPVIEMD